MSLWPTGVSVITAVGPGGPAGCTINALTSLSLEPVQVLACLDLRSDTLGAIRHNGRFAINVLGRDQIAIAKRFARKACAQGKLHGIEHVLLEGVPVITGCVAYFICDLVRELAGGDHAIVIGMPRAGVGDGAAEPLLFLQNSYWLPSRPPSDASPRRDGKTSVKAS